MNVLRTEAHNSPASVPTDGRSGGRTASSAPKTADAQVVYVDIDDGAAGQRLDNLLIRLCKGVPKSHLYRLIRSGQVRLNGKRCAADVRLACGDRLRLPPMRRAEPSAAAASAPPVEFPVIFENDALIVIDKPAGVAVHGGSGVSSGVIEQLRAARPQARFLELVHRLDRDTSGVMMIAKKRSALVELQRQLRERLSDKRYLAIVLGRWPLRSKRLTDPLHKFLTPDGERRVMVRADGLSAATTVTGLRHASPPGAGVCTLVECRIETGRTHQIRVHLSHAGFPLLGDEKYGVFDLNKSLDKIGHKRMFLHSFSLMVKEPESGRAQQFVSPMPGEFDALLDAGGADAGASATAPRAAGRRHP
ncbi:MAG: RluA family pseudouridine synthase [Burkholderiaceae bacterium]